MNTPPTLPVVLCFSGLDPSGGAGIQADIETIVSMGAHPAPVITALTVQDTIAVKRFEAVDSLLLVEQARAVLEDMQVSAIKIGMLANRANIEAIHSLLVDYPTTPVVLDPVLSGGGGGRLLDEDAFDALITLLLPQTTVLTPNSIEARSLARDADSLPACAESLLDKGCDYVLITGAHEATEGIVNTLYSNHRELEQTDWQRLPHQYHGSGCTLAAAIAALLAQGLDPVMAINEAQAFTWESLKHAQRIGMGQLIPNRLFWARDTD
ncbi:MAG: hydroxymethylpyrimidine/phosphomethylpyrimidine kinase [Gammaproteobacteria bacterium]